MVRASPATPVHWGLNQAGMQANVELRDLPLSEAKLLWSKAANKAADFAEQMMAVGLHKQVANRVLEPFLMVKGIITATEFDNWYELRMHPDAQPEIQALATAMYEASNSSEPDPLVHGEWHLPYVTVHDWNVFQAAYPWDFEKQIDLAKKVSAARCCRVSYLKHDGSNSTVEEDLALCARLAASRPIHASPFEHQATPDRYIRDMEAGHWESPELHGNFVGWRQHRKEIEFSFR